MNCSRLSTTTTIVVTFFIAAHTYYLFVFILLSIYTYTYTYIIYILCVFIYIYKYFFFILLTTQLFSCVLYILVCCTLCVIFTMFYKHIFCTIVQAIQCLHISLIFKYLQVSLLVLNHRISHLH